MYALSTLLSLLVATTLPPSSGAAGRLPSSAVFRVARGGASKSTSEKVAQAMERAAFEQEIEDYNAFQRGEGSLHRRMVCLPLTDNFDPPPGQQGHGKLQVGHNGHIMFNIIIAVASFHRRLQPPIAATSAPQSRAPLAPTTHQVSDRVSVPKEFAMGVLARKPEPPWQFELRKVSQAELDGEDEDEEEEEEYKRPSVHDDDEEAAEKAGEGESEEGGEGEGKPKKRSRPPTLEKLYCHVLDWQAPRNYVFVPKWMMKTLRLKPRDVVELTWVRLKEGAQITLRPRTKDFDNWANPQAVMDPRP